MAKKKATATAPRNDSTPENAASAAPPGQVALKRVNRPDTLKGIQELWWVDASTLRKNPKNWKRHSNRQVEALDAEFETVGWAGAFLYNLETGILLDGHGRSVTKHVQRTGVVPVLVGRWSEREQAQIVLHLDTIGAMFDTDPNLYRALKEEYDAGIQKTLETASTAAQEAIANLDTNLNLLVDSIDYGAPSSLIPDFQTTVATPEHKDVVDIDDAKEDLAGNLGLKQWIEIPFDAYGDSGVFGIPPMRPERIPLLPSENFQNWVGPETPEAAAYFYVYGSAAIEKVRSNKLVVSFYTYDRKFDAIWNDPTKFTARMINLKVMAAITPNFSSFAGGPWAHDIWQTYKARWLGRYWQELGIPVIPDILLNDLHIDNIFKTHVAGLPIGLNCISVQVQQKGDQDPTLAYGYKARVLHKVLGHLKPKQMILYHGPDLPDAFIPDIRERGVEVLPVRTWMWERGKVMREKEYLRHD